MKEPKYIPLEELFPNASKEKLIEIDLALTEQVRIAWDIWNRVVDDPVEFKRLLSVLTKNRVHKQEDLDCRCLACLEKFDQEHNVPQTVEPPPATTQETTPVEMLCK